ncbi:hypothetical protein ACJX0J_012379, partial [Zea mays]
AFLERELKLLLLQNSAGEDHNEWIDYIFHHAFTLTHLPADMAAENLLSQHYFDITTQEEGYATLEDQVVQKKYLLSHNYPVCIARYDQNIMILA